MEIGSIARRVRASALGLLFSAGLLLSCSTEGRTVDLTVDGRTIHAELAVTPAARERGLMFRSHMASDHGMLFVFPYDQQLSFWMKNTLIPLSVAYISSDGEIKEIHDMTPGSLDPVDSDHSVRYALEMNRGVLASWGVRPGDRVVLPPGLPVAAN